MHLYSNHLRPLTDTLSAFMTVAVGAFTQIFWDNISQTATAMHTAWCAPRPAFTWLYNADPAAVEHHVPASEDPSAFCQMTNASGLSTMHIVTIIAAVLWAVQLTIAFRADSEDDPTTWYQYGAIAIKVRYVAIATSIPLGGFVATLLLARMTW